MTFISMLKGQSYMLTTLILNSNVRRIAKVSIYFRGFEIGKRTPIYIVTHSPYMYIKQFQTYIGHTPLDGC
jgi:hypothetical protein